MIEVIVILVIYGLTIVFFTKYLSKYYKHIFGCYQKVKKSVIDLCNTQYIKKYVDVSQGVFLAYAILFFENVFSIVISDGKFNIKFVEANTIFLIIFFIGFLVWFYYYITEKNSRSGDINFFYLCSTHIVPIFVCLAQKVYYYNHDFPPGYIAIDFQLWKLNDGLYIENSLLIMEFIFTILVSIITVFLVVRKQREEE